MTRIFLGISSSLYDDSDHLSQLDGTVVDGRNIQNILLDNDLGGYDASLSKLLFSPNLVEVQTAINEMLFKVERIDCLTIYFAGHGISHKGTYYLCLRDTFTNKLSATALPLNNLFNVINDTQPLQTNIIIDACEAGGLVSDLVTLIKPEVFGNANSPSVSLFGSCMRDQVAEEDNSGGYATQEMLKYIKGEVLVDTKWPFLDLVQIGRNVSVRLQEKGSQQTPVVWGLSLTGFSTFSKNPHFQKSAFGASSMINLHTFVSSDLDIGQHEKEKIWEQYLKIPHTGITPSLIYSLVNSVKKLQHRNISAAKIGSFLLGTAEGFSMRVAENSDVFSEVEVLSACGAAFLPIIEEINVEQLFLVLIDRLLQSAVKAFDELAAALTDENALMSQRSGLNDLYFLPVRISKVLGWLALIEKAQVVVGKDKLVDQSKIKELIKNISAHYPLSFTCVSDEQAPYLLLYTQMQGFKDKDETFLFPIRCYINNYINQKGKLARSDASGEDVLNYLISRWNGDYTDITEVLSYPSELLSVLLDAAANTGMDDEINPHLRHIDHLSFNIFIPDKISTFADHYIENGINITMEIGSESGKGVFTLDDFRNNFKSFCSQRIRTLQNEKKTEISIAMALASFMMPNRVSWISRTL